MWSQEDRKRASHGDSPVDSLVFTQCVSVSKDAAGQFLFKSQFSDDLLVTVMCQGDGFLQGRSISQIYLSVGGSSNARSSHTVAHSSSLLLVLCRQSVHLPGMRVVTVLTGRVKELFNRYAAIMIREFLRHDGTIYPGIGGFIGCVGKGLRGGGGCEVMWSAHKA